MRSSTSERMVWANRRWLSFVAAATLLAAWAAGAAAGSDPTDNDENPHLWKPDVTTVAVFKNGLGFFLREGEAQLHEGWCVSKVIPPAAFGTLAVFAQDKNQVVDIVGAGKGEIVEFDDKDAPKTDAAKRARLQACRDLRVQLTYRKDNGKLTAQGKLRSIGPEFVILQDKSTNFAVPVKDITRMQVLDLPVRLHIKT